MTYESLFVTFLGIADLGKTVSLSGSVPW